jgi:CRISPR-associated protein Csm4
VQDGEALATTEETQSLQRRFADPLTGSIRLWTKETVSHVALDRLSNKSNVYGVGQVTFAEGCGLAIIVEYHDQTLRPTVEQGLRLLGDAGLGGRRSTGHGQFTIQDVNPLQLPVVQAANAFTTLSLYWPPRPEVEQGALDGASYNLVNRRGWLGAPGGMNLRRRSVRMLTEGAVLRRAPLGALLADVKPLDPAPAANVPHDVWRYGLALSIPCCAPDDKEAANG